MAEQLAGGSSAGFVLGRIWPVELFKEHPFMNSQRRELYVNSRKSDPGAIGAVVLFADFAVGNRLEGRSKMGPPLVNGQE